jgi:hypothetical protein
VPTDFPSSPFAAQTETAQENIQDWLKLDEEGPEFQLLVVLSVYM